MRNIIIAISIICLLATFIPPCLVFVQIITPEFNKMIMLIGTIGWFITAPFWMNKKQENIQPE